MSYRRGPNSPPLTSAVTWTLIAVAISACCAAVVSLLRMKKPAWKKKAYSSAPARWFVSHDSLDRPAGRNGKICTRQATVKEDVMKQTKARVLRAGDPNDQK